MPQEHNPIAHQNDGPPKIGRFLLYAERSIRLGEHCCALEGDIGIRTPLERSDHAGSAQLMVGRHTRCRNLFSPSTLIDMYAEVRDVWTDSLQRVRDIGIDEQHKFPGNMPELPLAMASGTGRNITLQRFEHYSLGPGTYGALTMLYESELWLAAGTYVFTSIKMDEHARLFALPGGVMVGVVGGLWADPGAKIVLHREEAKADHFQIFVAGGDAQITNNQSGSAPPVSAVVLSEESHLHALLATPHGTVLVKCGARINGAVAAFDIIGEDRVHAEFQSGFAEQPAGQKGSQQLSGYFGVPTPMPSLIGPVPQETQISLAIGLPVRDASGLNARIQQVSDPKNPNFRKFISQSDFKTTYGATDADYQNLKDWAAASSLTTVSTYSNNLLLSVKGTAAAIEQALFVNLVYRQRKDGSQFVSVDRNPSLNLSTPVLQISGLNDYYPPRLLANPSATGPNGTFRAADLRNAYLGVGTPWQALDGTGQVVGLVGFDVFPSSDVNSYAGLQLPALGQPTLPALNVTIAATEGGNPLSGSNGEAALDVEMVYAMAPGAQILFFQGSTGITNHLDDILHAMATSSPQLTVASCSLGFGYNDSANQALGEMAMTGVTFFCASGDAGDIGNNDPGNLKFANQTLVGGTFLNTSALTDPLPTPVYPTVPPYYTSENTWTGSGFATGGGVLNGVPIPDYQVGVSMATNFGSTTSRNYPDVALVAANVAYFFGGSEISGSGTSFASPLWAGFMALVNQFNQQNGGAGKAGFINQTIYDIGLTRGTAVDLYKVCFNDIADNGNNGVGGGGSGFTSVAGYDLCTGWGTPQAGLINQLGSTTPLNPNQPLSLVRFIVTTGKDDAGGGLHGSSQTADCFLPGGGVFTVTLRNSGEPNWDPGSAHEVDFAIPATDNNGNPVPMLTPSQNLTGVRINLVQSNPDWSADNWDISALQVSLFNPGSTPVLEINLVGTSVLQDGSTGLVRLSKSAGSSGSGPSSPIYPTGPASGGV
jgi:Pro-kumamolisin, activation domain